MLVAPFALVLLAVAGAALAARRRRRFVRALERTGWTVDEPDEALTTLLQTLVGPRPGRHRRLTGLALYRGAHDGRTYCFEYRWDGHEVPGAGRSWRRLRSALVVATPAPRGMPALDVVPRGAASPFAALGGDWEVESAQFNEQFRVITDDPRGASDVLHPRLVEHLLAPPCRTLSWRLVDGWVMAWVPDLRSHDEVVSLWALVRDVRRNLPPHLQAVDRAPLPPFDR